MILDGSPYSAQLPVCSPLPLQFLVRSRGAKKIDIDNKKRPGGESNIASNLFRISHKKTAVRNASVTSRARTAMTVIWLGGQLLLLVDRLLLRFLLRADLLEIRRVVWLWDCLSVRVVFLLPAQRNEHRLFTDKHRSDRSIEDDDVEGHFVTTNHDVILHHTLHVDDVARVPVQLLVI